MGQVHDLLETKGKRGLIEMNLLPRAVVEAAAMYMADEDNALACAYSGWAQCALPHRRQPPGKLWEIASERMRLVVEPGHRPSGGSGDGPMEPVTVPFGAYARLILLYLQTRALRTNSREVELGGSWREWMSRVGVPWGGSSGRAVRAQAELLGRCRLTFHFQGKGGASGLVNQSIVDRALFMEVPSGARQGRLSLETAKLSEGFFEALKRHPIPLEETAIRALANNSAALDCYVWLAYRLHSLHAPKTVSWPALKSQFGASYRELFHFKAKFAQVIALALAVYPSARVEIDEKGILLHPSRPPVALRSIAR